VIERSRVRLSAGALPGSLHVGQLSFPSSGVGKSSTSLLAGVKAGRVHLCRVAGITLSDPIWQVTPRSSRTSSHRGIYLALTFNLLNYYKNNKRRAVAAQTARSRCKFRCKFRYALFRDYRHTRASRLLESESVDSSINIVIRAT